MITDNLYFETGKGKCDYFTSENCQFIGHTDRSILNRHVIVHAMPYEPRHRKTGFSHMRKQRRRSTSR